MAKPVQKRTYAKGRTLSGSLARFLTALADRLVTANALSAHGALIRALLVPPLRIVAKALGWWSRSYLGQRLGIGWSLHTYKAGAGRLYEPVDIGNAWSEFKHGKVTLRPPSKRK